MGISMIVEKSIIYLWTLVRVGIQGLQQANLARERKLPWPHPHACAEAGGDYGFLLIQHLHVGYDYAAA